jgi:hypothetical protein
MTAFPTFAKIRAERAIREMRGLVLPFQPRTPEQETAAENTKAATWGELWIHLFDLWEDICLDTLDVMHHTALAALDGNIIDVRQNRMICDHMEVIAQMQERNRQVNQHEQTEAEHTGRLLADLFEEA